MPDQRLFYADNQTKLELYVGRTDLRRVTIHWLLGADGPEELRCWKRSDRIKLDLIGIVPPRFVRVFLRSFTELYRYAGFRLRLAPGLDA